METKKLTIGQGETTAMVSVWCKIFFDEQRNFQVKPKPPLNFALPDYSPLGLQKWGKSDPIGHILVTQG